MSEPNYSYGELVELGISVCASCGGANINLNKFPSEKHEDKEDHYCWYVIPEMMIGIPNYDHEGCVAYCIDELKDNGFIIRYTHPNLLLISWNHWIPGYVRNELKKKTGM